jgi:cell cycle related kinase
VVKTRTVKELIAGRNGGAKPQQHRLRRWSANLGSVMALAQRYVVGDVVGGGTFGEVRLGLERSSGRMVALKVVRSLGDGEGGQRGARGRGSSRPTSTVQQVPIGAFREACALRLLAPHEHVVEMVEMFASGSGICIVLELAELDLRQLLALRGALDEPSCKFVLRAAARGLAHCHAHGIMHRDIKPSNVLLWRSGQVKLADFGLARSFRGSADADASEQPRQLSHQVATRWYRAPELLFGSRSYDERVDTFSLGAVAGEMVLGYAMFPGENDIDQVYRVFQVLGSAERSVLEEDMGRPPDLDKVEFPPMQRIEGFFDDARASPELVAAIYGLLELSPRRRWSAQRLLENEVFFLDPLPAFGADLDGVVIA